MCKDNVPHVPNPLAEVLEDTQSRGVRRERDIEGIVEREVVEMVTDGKEEQKSSSDNLEVEFSFGCQKWLGKKNTILLGLHNFYFLRTKLM